MAFSGQEHWSGLPFSNPRKLIPFIVPILKLRKLSPERATNRLRSPVKQEENWLSTPDLLTVDFGNFATTRLLPPRALNSVLINSSRNQPRQKASGSCQPFTMTTDHPRVGGNPRNTSSAWPHSPAGRGKTSGATPQTSRPLTLDVGCRRLTSRRVGCRLNHSPQRTLPPSVSHLEVCYSFSFAQLFATARTAARQAPLSMGFSRQEYWSGSPCLSPGDLPDLGIEPRSPALQAESLLAEPAVKPSHLERVYGLVAQSCLTLCDPVK